METDYNKGHWRFLDYDKLLKKVEHAYMLFTDHYEDPINVQVLISEINIKRVEHAFYHYRRSQMYSPSYCGIAKNSMLMFGIRFPDEATYPYNDKIVFYTNNSCYPEGVIFEIDINDIEVE